jgi:SNF2 family DNA or RNA helicase
MKYKFKTKPYRHQVKAIRKALPSLRLRRAAALFMPMRSGKSKVAIDLVAILHKKYGVKRVLIVAPLSVMGVWKNQIKIHMPDEVRSQLRIVIVNYAKVFDREKSGEGWEPVSRTSLYKYNPEVIIIDESHKIGNPAAVQSLELYKLQRDIEAEPFKLILTGTPFHRKPLMVYGQFRFLDESVFGGSYPKFKKRYAKFGGYAGFKLIKYLHKKELIDKIAPLTFLMKTLPLVAPQHEVIPYALEESEPAYESMANESIALVENGVIEAPIALVRALRLAQICGGRLRDSEGTLVRVGGEKRRAFAGLVESFVDSEVDKFVVFHRFVPEMKDSVEVCREAGYEVYLMHGGTSRREREQRIAEFDEVQGRGVFICQVSTGALGIDLSCASISVFYSLPESLVDFDQDCARIRKWKDKRTLTYYYFIGEGTIEEVQLSSLRANLDLINTLERNPKLLSYSAHG